MVTCLIRTFFDFHLLGKENFCIYRNITIHGPPCGMALTCVGFLGKTICSTHIIDVCRRHRMWSKMFVIMVPYQYYNFFTRISFPTFLLDADRWRELSPQNNPYFHNFWRTPYGRFIGGSISSGQSLWNPPTSCTRPPGIRTTFRQPFLYLISRNHRQVCAEVPLANIFF